MTRPPAWQPSPLQTLLLHACLDSDPATASRHFEDWQRQLDLDHIDLVDRRRDPFESDSPTETDDEHRARVRTRHRTQRAQPDLIVETGRRPDTGYQCLGKAISPEQQAEATLLDLDRRSPPHRKEAFLGGLRAVDSAGSKDLPRRRQIP